MTKFEEAMVMAMHEDWKRISSQMSWVYRKGGAQIPPELQRWFHGTPTKQEWDILRQRINAKRNRLKRERAAEKRATIKQRRRQYMRDYMLKYRQKKEDSYASTSDRDTAKADNIGR